MVSAFRFGTRQIACTRNASSVAVVCAAAGVLFLAAVPASAAAGSGGVQAKDPGSAAPKIGDPLRGEALFFGSVPFRNGGLPCVACHTAGGEEPGGTLGPDLTRAYADFGDEALADILLTFPTLTMKPVYGPRPLTTAEQADVRAFLRLSAGRTFGAASGLAILSGAAGVFFVLAAIPHIVWRGRHRGVRRALRPMEPHSPERVSKG